MRVWLSQTLRLPIFFLFPSYPSCLFSKAPSPINRRPTHCILHVEFEEKSYSAQIVWALSETYVLLGLRSYLKWFVKLSSGGQHTYLGAHRTPSGVTFLTHHHKFSHSIFLPFLYSILCVCLLVSILCCSWVSLIIMSMVHHLGGHDHHWC